MVIMFRNHKEKFKLVLYINGTTVEKVPYIKFLGIQITGYIVLFTSNATFNILYSNAGQKLQNDTTAPLQSAKTCYTKFHNIVTTPTYYFFLLNY